MIDPDIKNTQSGSYDPGTCSPFMRFAKCYPSKLLNNVEIQNFDAHNYWNIGSTSHSKPIWPVENEFAILTAGDNRGKSYTDSLERFFSGITDPISVSFLDEKLKKLSRGALDISKNTKRLIVDHSQGPFKLETECGVVDISQRLEHCNGEIDRLLEQSEIELFRRLGAKNTTCLLSNQPDTSPVLQVSPVCFEKNRSDLAHIFNNPNDLNRPETLDNIRKRLLALARFSQDKDLEVNKS